MGPYYKEAFNTIKASRFELLCARLFGKKSTGYDGALQVTVSRWRGRYYLIDHKEPTQ